MNELQTTLQTYSHLTNFRMAGDDLVFNWQNGGEITFWVMPVEDGYRVFANEELSFEGDGEQVVEWFSLI